MRGTLLGWVISGVGYVVLGALLPTSITLLQSIGIAAVSLAASLALGLVLAALLRRWRREIDAVFPQTGSALDITLRYLTNTTEQALLFSVVAAALILSGPEIARNWLAEAGIWFVIARTLFAVGFAQDPVARTIGYTATLHPTLILLAIAGWAAFT